MGKHRPDRPALPIPAVTFIAPDSAAPRSHRGRRFAAATGATLAATAAMTLTPMTGELPVASANVGSVPAPVPVAQTAPAQAPAAQAPAADHLYLVKAGDTLSKIGAATGVQWREIAAANGISAPYTIYVGQELRLTTEIPPVASQAVQEAAVTPAPAPATGIAAQAVRVALAQVGDPYVWGEEGPDAFDCSGLVQYAYAQAGISLPRTSSAQAGAGAAVSRANLQPGDLVFYYSPISHVAMYIGNGQVVQAAQAGTPVQVTSIDWAGAPVAYRHVA